MAERVARAFWITGPRQGELRSEALPAPAAGEILVRTLYTGVSRGTEALVFAARVPESQHVRMRAPFQAGNFPAPVKYGYANVGEVEEGPAELRGRRVFCLYPHQTHYVVPAAAAYLVPDDVPSGRAVLAANLETAVNGLWDAAPHLGDRIAVVGAGTVGCLAAWLAARIPGAEVELIDIDARKAAAADALGVAFRSPREARAETDVVIHASGSEAGLATALALAGFEARVVELSWYGTDRVAAPLGEHFHSRRLCLVASQVGAIAPALDVLLSGESSFDDLPAIMRRLTDAPDGALCHRISFQ